MCSKQKFYICKKCGNLIGIIKDEGIPMMCCGEEMTQLTPNTVDASLEKHLPDVTVSGDRVDVQIGSVPHPMEDTHHITFVYVETEKGGQRKCLTSGK
jgi:superoxide reductase